MLDLLEFFDLSFSRDLCVNLCSLISICFTYLFIYQPYNLEQLVYPQTMFINSKIFWDFILFSGMKSHNCVYGYALFLFENTLLLSLLLLLLLLLSSL